MVTVSLPIILCCHAQGAPQVAGLADVIPTAMDLQGQMKSGSTHFLSSDIPGAVLARG